MFNYGLAKFSEKEFEDAGLNADDLFLIQFMANQEAGHAVALSHLLGRKIQTFHRDVKYSCIRRQPKHPNSANTLIRSTPFPSSSTFAKE